jgi:hypothetical protein
VSVVYNCCWSSPAQSFSGPSPEGSWPHITVSDSRLPQPGGPGPRIYMPQEQGGPVMPPDTGFHFRRLIRLTGIRWRYSTPPPHRNWTPSDELEYESESYVTTDCQSASLSWNKAPFWGLRQYLDYCLTIAGLLMWGALSDERTGLSFTIAAGPRQGSHSRVRVLWDSRPYFTVSDSRLPFSSPPTTRRATVEVLDPVSTLSNRSRL